MAEKSKRRNSAQRNGARRKQPARVQASALGSTRISSSSRDRLVHPDATPLHQIPKDNEVEAALSKIENLLGKGHYGAALKGVAALTVGDSPQAGHYELIRHEKMSRAHLGIADRYFIRGDLAQARTFYQRALQVGTANPTVKGITETAGQVFDNLLNRRKKLIEGLRRSIQTGSFEQWCGQKRDLGDLTILDVREIRQSVVADFQLERIFGEHPPIVPQPGFIAPLLPESDSVDSPSALPGSVFRSVSEGPIDVDIAAAGSSAAGRNNRVRASLAMPLIGNVLTAKLRLFAVDNGLNVAGQASGTVPLFRYEYLRGKAKQTIAHIQQVESRMLPIQFALDDFAEVVDAIRRPLAEQEAELEAIKQRIRELTDAHAALAQSEKAVEDVVVLLHAAEDECDCDWWCWFAGITLIVAGVVLLVVVIFSMGALAAPALAAAILAGVAFSLFEVEGIRTITCDNVPEVTNNYESALTGLRQAIREVEAELNHALVVRDVLIANINALSQELSEVYQSNAARVLDAKTLDLIQAQYNGIRQSLLTRAQAVATLAQDAFNFERDTELNLIRDAYFDKDRKDYSAAETLLRDLDGLDYIDITGRMQKAMQLSHAVSLRKHYPVSFLALRLTGGARFTTELKEFDRWFPGTHQQRIKEIKVEVLIEGKPVPVRGYLSNDGVSMVRFQDTGGKRKVDGVHVFAEPDADIAKLCYKRLQRRRHVDTMAFPDFDSYLHEDRMRKLQDRERNFFENVGLESTWVIEFLPDQPIDLSKLTDVLIHFQYEALFDDNLKRLLEKKRYTGRRESSAFSIKQFLAEKGKIVDFSDTVAFRAPVHRLEAPAIERKIVNVGFIVKPKQQPHLDGPAELDVAYDGAAPIHVVTNEVGVVATAADHPAGTGLAELEAMAHGKGLDKLWSINIAALPGGLSADAVDDIFLLLNYEYSS